MLFFGNFPCVFMQLKVANNCRCTPFSIAPTFGVASKTQRPAKVIHDPYFSRRASRNRPILHNQRSVIDQGGCPMVSRFVVAFLVLSYAGAAAAQQASTQTPPAISPQLKCDTCDPGGGGGGTPPPPPPPPKPKITSFSVTPTGSSIEVYASNGIDMTINMATNVVTFNTPSSSTQMTVSQAMLAASNGDATQAAALQARFQAILANPKKTSLLIQSGTIVPSARKVGKNGMVTAQAVLSPNLYPAPGGDGFSCDDAFSCGDVVDQDFGTWGTYNFDWWDSPAGGGVGSSDWNYWNTWRQDACDRKTSEVTQIGGGSLATLGLCGTVEFGGATALGCVGAFVLTADSLSNYSSDNAQCNSTYPGAGNWP
jgi:hypothetical protein